MTLPEMDREWHLSLSHKAGEFRAVDKMLRAVDNRRGAFEGTWPEAAADLTSAFVKDLESLRRGLYREVGKIMAASDVFRPWLEHTRGISAKGVGLLTGCLPFPQDMETVSATWKYLGLHVVDGEAPRRKQGEWSGFSSEYRAYALYRVGDPIIKVGGPYRQVYDDRKAHTLDTHPPMLDEGEGCETCDEAYARTRKERAEHEYSRERQAPRYDCANLGGVHWTKGHRHADALRVTTKEVFVDWWRVAHGQSPRTGHLRGDTHRTPAEKGAVHA